MQMFKGRVSLPGLPEGQGLCFLFVYLFWGVFFNLRKKESAGGRGAEGEAASWLSREPNRDSIPGP